MIKSERNNRFNFIPGDLVVAVFRIYDSRKGCIEDNVYGLYIDTHQGKIDIQIPDPYTLDNENISSGPCTETGLECNERFQSSSSWLQNSYCVVSVYISDVIKVIHMFGVSPIKISIKNYLKQIFPYVPRYINHSLVKNENITGILYPSKYENKTLPINYKDLLSADDYYELASNFVAYTKKQPVRREFDPCPGQPIMVHPNNYRNLGLDCLPNNKKCEIVFKPNTLVFGIPQHGPKGWYFSEWILGNPQLLFFWTLLYYEDHPNFYNTKTNEKLTEAEILQKLSLSTDNVDDTVFRQNYLRYQHNLPEHLLSLLYICIKYQRPEKAWQDLRFTLDSDDKLIFNSVFQFITV